MGKLRLIRSAVIVTVITGAAAGVVSASAAAVENGRLIESLNVYLNAVETRGFHAGLFLQRLSVYGQMVAVVWFLAFVPPARVLAFVVLLAHAFGLGFTAAALQSAAGRDGLLHAALQYFPQNLVFLPVLCYVACGCLERAKKDYSSRLLTGLLASVLAAFADVWISPLLLRLI
jgi:hypothetical protein